MNISMIRYILGHILKIEGSLMLLPCIVALIYREPQGLWYLVIAAACLLLGLIVSWKKPASNMFYLKEGCIATALGWILLSLFGCLPFCLTGEIPSYVDALFETVSGFTTTGASILSDVEALSHCSLFWRSFTHWVGGMGVLVFLLAIVPMNGGSHINLLRAESPGPSVGKLVPKIRYTARILYIIYIGLTLLEVVFLLCGGMSVFEALTTSFGTAGTGGFGIKNSSIAGYSAYIQWVVTAFMIIFGVNFNAYYFLLFKNFRQAFGMREVRCYLGIIIAAIIVVFIDILPLYSSASAAITDSAFQVASIITTTGFSTTDFDLWPELSKTILVLLMFIGACAGSTGGGIKVSRIMLLFKSIVREMRSYIHPKSIQKLRIDGKAVGDDEIRGIMTYFITFMAIFIGSVLLISIDGKGLTTTFTAVAATINNIGPGLELVGPTQNFSGFSVFSKFVMMFDMLAGRLELFPLLILFCPSIWCQLATQRRAQRKAAEKRS